ncbi:hypothetical protein ACP4OV_027098 [Aristida adscensionis]
MSTVTCEVEPSCAATAGGEAVTKLDGKVGAWPPPEQRRLLFAVAGKGKGRRLGDGRGGGSALAGFYWYGNLLLGLRRRRGGGAGRMQVFVRTPAGSTLALDVRPSDTVGEVKARIQARERVAAGQQRLVFAGRHLADGRRTLADYGVGREANLHLLLRLPGGLAGGHTNTAAAAAGGGNPHWMTTAGLLAAVVAVGAVLPCCFPPSASCCSGGLGGALLVFMLAVAVAGVNLITAGVCLARAPTVESLGRMARFVVSTAAAIPRRSVAVLGVVAAAAGIIVGDAQAQPVISFVCFALLLVSMALVTIGLASCTS